MKLPKTLKVKNRKYAVLVVPYIASKPGEVTRGYCVQEDRFIAIREKLGAREAFATLLHETLHAIEHEYSLPIKHDLVYALEEALSQVLLDNFRIEPKK